MSRRSRDGAGLRKRKEKMSLVPWMTKDLVLEMCGAKYSSTSGSCEEYTDIMMSIITDLDRSRYVRVWSTSAADRNCKLVQRDGLDVRVERQC